ncbi:hypothetical protein NBE98_09855 [Clostridium swellfunianum]|uniref:DUF6906 family protein n=1 Tax=Clostridium swellfunianum TaxID=1367462 RepID=UPI00202FEBCA|nr:hypothetical protein [Clostridium swellfunianum]MCM0648678.1 hypothetical protein [Clostridium swellfunianum]
MKNGKKPSMEEKKFLTKQGLDPDDYLRTKKTAEGYEFYRISTGKLITIRR